MRPERIITAAGGVIMFRPKRELCAFAKINVRFANLTSGSRTGGGMAKSRMHLYMRAMVGAIHLNYHLPAQGLRFGFTKLNQTEDINLWNFQES